MHLTAHTEQFKLDGAFTISRGSRTEAHVVRVSASHAGATGQGECVPYARYGETVSSVVDQIESLAARGDALTREALQGALPAGAARNAVDCALWDLEAKAGGTSVAALARLGPLAPVTTAYTIGIDTAEAMEAKAREHSSRPLLKIKLGSPGDVPRLRAVRAGAPTAELIVDANEAWTRDDYLALLPVLDELGVTLVEQPFHADNDDALLEVPRPIRICADESCHDRTSLPGMAGKYDVINIKLDKTGGLTEALALHAAAREQGFQIMVGCMVGTSLAMAPALLVAQDAETVDLDGPLLLAEDRDPPLAVEGSVLYPAQPSLWG
ncbi:MAG: N-acetyl-D-Glu racemase DgcA [Pseudomonadota bacterium]